MTDRYKPKNTMFWRVDTALADLRRDQRWIDFHHACGRDGLFFDDIDPVADDPQKDVTDRMRRSGYSAVAVRHEKDSRGDYYQVLMAKGRGKDPVEAVVAAYRAAIAAGDPVTPGLEALFDGPFRAVGVMEQPDTGEIETMIGAAETAASAVCGIDLEGLIG